MRAYKVGIFVTWALAFFVSSILTVLNWLNLEKDACYAWMTWALMMLLFVCGCNIGIRRRSRARLVSSHNRLDIESLTYTLLFVSFLALVCWIPLVIVNYLSYFNSCVNPMVYAYRVSIECYGSWTVKTHFRSYHIAENKVNSKLIYGWSRGNVEGGRSSLAKF